MKFIQGEAGTNANRIIYFTKQHLSSGIWQIHNEAVLTERLRAVGIEIISPEELSLYDQIKLWKEGGLFIASASSALHSAAFVGKRKLIVLNNVAEIWSNQVLIDKVSGNDSLYLYDTDNFEYRLDGLEGFAGNLYIKNMNQFVGELVQQIKEFRKDSIS
ncbi:glycosyltransferase family 61 protein [Acetobacteraceae bacterium]|nr:glycosyltransferase family 61 protein [Acetobacteraceae bacterium]